MELTSLDGVDVGLLPKGKSRLAIIGFVTVVSLRIRELWKSSQCRVQVQSSQSARVSLAILIEIRGEQTFVPDQELDVLPMSGVKGLLEAENTVPVGALRASPTLLIL